MLGRLRRWLLGDREDRAPRHDPDADLFDDETATSDPEPVEIPITDSIDLHPFLPAEVRDVVEAYLDAAVERGYTEVRIIHGRGIGVQRQAVRKLLERDPRVESFADAADRSGWGATVAKLFPPGLFPPDSTDR